MSNVRDTSLNSYIELKDSGKLEAREQEIYELIKQQGPMTDNEITQTLGYKDRNEISPARWRLVDQGVLIDYGKRKCSITERTVYQWRIVRWVTHTKSN